MVEIYGLYDRDGNLRYIGKANSAQKRLASHMRDARRRTTPVYRWIQKNGAPEMRVLHVCAADDDWRDIECNLIASARARGEKLLNVAMGGDEPFCSIQQRSLNARMLNARMNDDPRAARMREIKRIVMTAAHHGNLMERHRAKFRDLAAYAPSDFGVFKDL